MSSNISELKPNEIKEVSGGVTYATATSYPTSTFSAPTYTTSIYASALKASAPRTSLSSLLLA